jgi:hypothetical protein
VDEVGDYNAPPIATNASNFGGEAALDLDDLRIYDRALSAAEVEALYDAAPPIPEQVPGLALWLDANDIDGDGAADTLAHGASVSLWVDKSGNDRDANQSDPNATFTYRAGNPVTMPGLVLDGSNDYMEILDANVSAANIFVVVEMDQNSQNQAAIVAQQTNRLIRRLNQTESLRSQHSQTDGNDFSHPDGLHLVDGQATGSFPYDQLHVLATGKGSSSNEQGEYSMFTLGKDTTQSGRHWKGEIAEILIYNRALSAAEIDWIQGYLGQKWGVTIQSE